MLAKTPKHLLDFDLKKEDHMIQFNYLNTLRALYQDHMKTFIATEEIFYYVQATRLKKQIRSILKD